MAVKYVAVERIIRVDDRELSFALTLPPEERLRQANAAFRLCLDLHRPYRRPWARGFSTLGEFFRFDEETRRPR